MNNSKYVLAALYLYTLTLVSGCASTAAGVTKGLLDKVFEPDPSSIVVTMRAGKDVNPDISERASPLVTRFYELKSLSVFNSTDFFTLYDQDVALLGDELLVRDEYRFQPGEEKQLTRELQLDTRFIGIIGAFRNIENATWRKTLTIDLNDKTTFVVEFGENAIEIRKISD